MDNPASVLASFPDRDLSLGGLKNQMAPFGCFHTSYFAARSLLWAIFCSIIVNNSLSPKETNRLQKPFTINGHGAFRGILLVEFSHSLSKFDRLKHLHLDQADIEQWHPIVQGQFHLAASDPHKRRVWKMLEPIHKWSSEQSGTNPWPADVITAPEREKTVNSLGFWTGDPHKGLLRRPMYRNAHCTDEVVSDLNEKMIRVLAIEFVEAQKRHKWVPKWLTTFKRRLQVWKP